MTPLHVLRRDVRANVWDYAVAGLMVAIAIVALTTRIDVQEADIHHFHPDTWWSWVVTIAICATLIGRRRWPLRTLAVGLVLMLPLEIDRHRDSIALFALVIALASVAAYLPIRLAWRGLAMIAALYAALNVGRTTIITQAPPLTAPALLAAGFALGLMLRRGRTRQELEVETAIERGATAVETADLQAAEERLRMAQELHDVVAHSLSVIAVQAGIGVHLIEREPVEAARALEAIRTTSRTAAGELTRLVGVLRDGGPADTADAPALSDVAVLIEQIRTTGIPITFTTNGDLDSVPAGVSLAAYRIVQEALTNVVRHAGRAQATVTVWVSDDHVELRIEDDGRGTTTVLEPESSGSGHGLIGMSERAQMYGGDARSGPRPGGGFRVQATLRYFASPVAHEAPPPAADPTCAYSAAPHRRWLPPAMWDLALASAMAGIATLELIGSDPRSEPNYSPTQVWTWAIRIGCCLALIARRRCPTLTFAAVCVLSLTLHIGGNQVGLTVFALAISLYTVASYATTRRLVGAAIATYAEMAIIASSEPREVTAAAAAWICILLTAVAVGGYVAGRDRRRRTTDLANREDAAHAHSRRSLLVITTERLRIADELSTIITRSIHSIAHEAGAGSQMVELDPIAARKTLEVISAISRDALSDLRRLLKRLRTESEPASYAPIASTLEPVAAGDVR